MDLFTYLMVKKGHKLSTNDEFSYLLARGNQEYTTKIGTSIDVKGSVASPMTIELKPHELTQDETPTPENPQEVHVITGDNTIHVSNGKTTTNYPINLDSIEYCKIGNYQDSIFKSSGKNLLNNTNLDYDYTNITLSQNVLTTIDTGIRYATTRTSGSPFVLFKLFDMRDYIGKTVRLKGTFGSKGYLRLVKTNSDFSTRTVIETGSSGTTITYTIPEDLGDTYYLSYGLVLDNVTASENSVDFTNLIITIDNSDMTYEPFGTDWYIKKEIGKVVLDGSEDWVSGSYGTNSWVLSNTISVAFDTNELQIMTRKFKGIKHADRNTNDNVIYTSSNTQFWLRNTPYTTKAEVQSGMSGEAIYYILSSPTYTKITDETLISQLETTMNSKDKRTIITQTNDDLPFIIKATIKIK